MSRKVTDFEQARVASGEQMAGRLERTNNGSRFIYESAFLEVCRARGWGVGFKVPVQPVVETPGVGLHSFFAGLLPEYSPRGADQIGQDLARRLLHARALRRRRNDR